tara:strand:- start:1667 stop:1879 length:213 start_codon:yes stop_codon:yes gene_type:complete
MSINSIPDELPAKTRIIEKLGDAVKNIKDAYSIGIGANGMAADLSVFRDMQQINKQIGDMMLAINKLRGL